MNASRIWLYVVMFLLLAVFAGAAVLGLKMHNRQPVEIELRPAAAAPAIGSVYVSGAVSRPGLYDVNDGDTLSMLLEQAGLAPGTGVNQVRVYVPIDGESRGPQRIDINRAEAWLLEALPGIGEVRANAIVDYRTQNGPFRRAEDLVKVNGISLGVMENIRGLVTAGE